MRKKTKSIVFLLLFAFAVSASSKEQKNYDGKIKMRVNRNEKERKEKLNIIKQDWVFSRICYNKYMDLHRLDLISNWLKCEQLNYVKLT